LGGIGTPSLYSLSLLTQTPNTERESKLGVPPPLKLQFLFLSISYKEKYNSKNSASPLQCKLEGNKIKHLTPDPFRTIKAGIMTLDKQLIGFSTLSEILETAFWTAPIAGTIPSSIMLIGPPGTGKSKGILQFNSPSIHVTNDITSSGIVDILEGDKSGVIRHLVVPDFNIVVSHKQSTSALTIATLLTVMSEGIARVDDGRRKKEVAHAPIGVITAMTRDVYDENVQKFRKLGIGRRFSYIFFGYCYQTRTLIQHGIRNGEITLQQLIPSQLNLPDVSTWPLSIIIDEPEAIKLQELSTEMSANMSYQPKWIREDGGWTIKPFRGHNPLEFTPHMVLRTMAKARAYRHGRMRVNEDDVAFIVRFVASTNYSIPIQL
jgi:hypothetical protein